MSLTYAQYVTTVAGLAVVAPTNADFLAILPNAIDYTELRIQRDLDLLATVSGNPTPLILTPNNRVLTFTQGTFVTIQDVNIVLNAFGLRAPCLPVTKEFLDYTWPTNAGASAPQYFAMFNQNTIYFGPWPSLPYTAELIGTVRFTPLSATNTTNFLSTFFPDAYVAATMCYLSLYQRNFAGNQGSNDQMMGGSWEMTYQSLIKPAEVEEKRKMFQSVAWTSQSPSPVATPSR